MLIISDKKTYNFEEIHLPRIYINDVEKVRRSLGVLQRKGSLTNREMAEETQRVRSEDIREIFYLLWGLGFGISVTKKGREIAFLSNEKLQGFLELSDKELKETILQGLKLYNPFIAVLDKLIEYRKKSIEFTEKDITKNFHNDRCDGGRVDNTHPLLRWSKDKDWGLVKDKTITKRGIRYVAEAKKLNIAYVHHTVDLKASRGLNIITHILSEASFEDREKVSYEDIIGLTENIDDFELTNAKLIPILKELIRIGLPIEVKGKEVLIKSKIYHEITPQYYIKFRIHIVDGIDELETEEEGKIEKIDEKKILKEYSAITSLIIHDENIDVKQYPKHSKIVGYREFIKINGLLPKLKIQNIILPPGWKPLKVSKINGILLAFVRSGGNLLIFHAPMGRIGSNRNLFNWLTYDLERISFIHSNSSDLKGYFTFPFGEKYLFTSKHGCEEITKNSKKYLILSVKYHKGLIVFLGFNPSKKFFSKYAALLKANVQINPKAKEWIYRYIPSINRLPEVHREQDLYPMLKGIMTKNFGFKFDPRITGKVGQTDLFIETPLFSCCEVTPPRNNTTGLSKVSEVRGHRDIMVAKDEAKGKKRFGDNKVGACVFGPSFTIEAGEDKAGAVDGANAMDVSLISYRDLYELVCLSEKVKLTKENLFQIFFNEEKKAEAALRIYKLMKKLKVL